MRPRPTHTEEPLHKTLLLSINAFCASIVWAQAPSPPPPQNKLSVHWEELTAADFRDGIARAQGTCLLPFGILEKHGPHLPLGNDLLNVRYAALNAAQQEYAIVFPEYYFGQIFEARQQPGTVAYSARLQLEMLQETTDEMARNGCKKIIIVNGHGGNNSLLPYFAQTQLSTPHDFVVYVLGIMRGGPGEPKHKSNPATDMHAGESETSMSKIGRASCRDSVKVAGHTRSTRDWSSDVCSSDLARRSSSRGRRSRCQRWSGWSSDCSTRAWRTGARTARCTSRSPNSRVMAACRSSIGARSRSVRGWRATSTPRTTRGTSRCGSGPIRSTSGGAPRGTRRSGGGGRGGTSSAPRCRSTRSASAAAWRRSISTPGAST